MQKSLFPLNFGFLTAFVRISKVRTNLRTNSASSPLFLTPFIAFTVLLMAIKIDTLRFVALPCFGGLRTSLSAKLKT